MAEYIKSYSNYVLKKKHADTNEGTIYERDITTIGGVDNFTTGQVPVYRSGNFIISVNNDTTFLKNPEVKGWYENENGDTWTSDILSSYTLDYEASYDETLEIKPDYRDLRDYAYYGSCSELIRSSINDIVSSFPGELFMPTETIYVNDGSVQYTEEAAKAAFGDSFSGSGTTVGVTPYYVSWLSGLTTNGEVDKYTSVKTPIERQYLVDNPFGIDIFSSAVPDGADPLKYFADGGVENYVAYKKENGEWDFQTEYPVVVKTIVTPTLASNVCDDTACVPICPEPGEKYGYVILDIGGNEVTINLYLGSDGNIIYTQDDSIVTSATTSFSNYRIRPKDSIINAYFSNLDTFERLLLNRQSTPMYTADFELIGENSYGYYTYTDRFTLPTTYGGYNLGSVGNRQFEDYLNRLVTIGEFYDERFSDNLWRSMTHESIKNLDWTYSRNNRDRDGDTYIEGVSKIQKILRVYGREFDEIKLYIDAIANVNTVTYDESNNLPDYFLTDELEKDGWTVSMIQPFSGDTRLYDDVFVPYVSHPKSKRGSYVYVCDPVQCTLNFCTIETRVYGDDAVYTYTQANNEFMRRLALNSEEILRHKGTIDGLEMMLGMFGLRSKRHVFKDEKNFIIPSGCSGGNIEMTAEGNSYYSQMAENKDQMYDYEIREFSISATPISGEDVNTIDGINSAKTISYDTLSFRRGEYVPYQGLPVKKYHDDVLGDVLVPFFEKDAIYDGNPYYQMDGGWLYKNYSGYSNSHTDSAYTETIRDIKAVNTILDLIKSPELALSSGDICEVKNLDRKEYVVADGEVHEILKDEDNMRYFTVSTINNGLSIGLKMYTGNIVISSKNGYANVNLDDERYYNRTLRVYLSGNNTADIHSASEVANIEVRNFNGGTNFFRINMPAFYNEISNLGWEQLKETDPEYIEISRMKDNFEGNNPHFGHMKYDGGHKYFTYFSDLFKYAKDNDLFDYGNLPSNSSLDSSVYGFKGLINDEDICDTDYYKNLKSDSKCHYSSDESLNCDDYKVLGNTVSENTDNEFNSEYDGTLHMNTKVMEIDFNLKKVPENSRRDYVTYIDKVILPYLEQMIPSTAICRIGVIV